MPTHTNHLPTTSHRPPLLFPRTLSSLEHAPYVSPVRPSRSMCDVQGIFHVLGFAAQLLVLLAESLLFYVLLSGTFLVKKALFRSACGCQYHRNHAAATLHSNR